MREIVEIILGIPWMWVFGIVVVCLIAIWCVRKIAGGLLGNQVNELTFKEYRLLKDLEDAGYMWIARDYNGALRAYNVCPKRVTKKVFLNMWKPPENLYDNVRVARVRKEVLPQIGRFSKKPYRIADILYL